MGSREIRTYLQECSQNYLREMGTKVPLLHTPCIYPSGCPAGTVVPIQTNCSNIMVIGPYPPPVCRILKEGESPRPAADPLSPLGLEPYFNGREMVYPFGGDRSSDYFTSLGVNISEAWISSIVKIPLFGESIRLLEKLAEAGIPWILREIGLCSPRVVITLGEIPGRILEKRYKGPLIRLPFPRREDRDWDKQTIEAFRTI